MNDKQLNIYDMYLRVQKAGNMYQNIWSINSRFTANFKMFTDNVSAIDALRNKQELDRSGITKNKEITKNKLVDLTMRVVKGLRSYAVDTQNTELAVAVNYNKTLLTASRESALSSACEVVYNKANANVAYLGDYGIDLALLTTMQTTIQAYKLMLPDTQGAISESKMITSQLADLFKSTSDLLKDQLDGKMEQYKETQPDFYNAYFNARNVISRGKSVKQETEAAE